MTAARSASLMLYFLPIVCHLEQREKSFGKDFSAFAEK